MAEVFNAIRLELECRQMARVVIEPRYSECGINPSAEASTVQCRLTTTGPIRLRHPWIRIQKSHVDLFECDAIRDELFDTARPAGLGVECPFSGSSL